MKNTAMKACEIAAAYEVSPQECQQNDKRWNWHLT
jgi:hypothetical protein